MLFLLQTAWLALNWTLGSDRAYGQLKATEAGFRETREQQALRERDGQRADSGGPVAGGRLEAVEAFVEGADQAGPVLDTGQGALVGCVQAALCFGEDDLGQSAGAALVVEEVGVVADVCRNGAGVTGQLQGDLFVVVRGRVAGSVQDRTAVIRRS